MPSSSSFSTDEELKDFKADSWKKRRQRFKLQHQKRLAGLENRKQQEAKQQGSHLQPSSGLNKKVSSVPLLMSMGISINLEHSEQSSMSMCDEGSAEDILSFKDKLSLPKSPLLSDSSSPATPSSDIASQRRRQAFSKSKSTNDAEALMAEEGCSLFRSLCEDQEPNEKLIPKLLHSSTSPIFLPIDKSFEAKYVFDRLHSKSKRRGKTWKEAVFLFLEHPCGWLCFFYNFCV